MPKLSRKKGTGKENYSKRRRPESSEDDDEIACIITVQHFKKFFRFTLAQNQHQKLFHTKK